jgi:hypothetical protein
MAYVGYDPHARATARPTAPGRGLPPMAWGRLVAVAASLVAWAGIIAAARAIF